MIKAENLVKKYKSGGGDLLVLKGIDFSVADGEFISVIGRSGSGKSTLLYQLGLLDRPTEGRIIIGDIDANNLREEERTSLRLRELGYVFQDYALVPELTGLENVMIPLLMQGLSKAKARERAADTLQEVGLGERLNNTPSKLSGGEQQRVSIARAIAHNPKILFADEPTANLDNETSLGIIKLFQKLHAVGQTIIMVTHEPEYAKLTDRIVTLFDGQIIADQKP
ncbi:MAG: ABC transporter ATP-binding permease protein [Parcubacteria group bacterium GW2011_GWA2_47_21]|nr:MAG: ABC transporter ATP-binding permease protein [Parcubacteria group bacterium GW2011_GWA2_47_21]